MRHRSDIRRHYINDIGILFLYNTTVDMAATRAWNVLAFHEGSSNNLAIIKYYNLISAFDYLINLVSKC